MLFFNNLWIVSTCQMTITILIILVYNQLFFLVYLCILFLSDLIAYLSSVINNKSPVFHIMISITYIVSFKSKSCPYHSKDGIVYKIMSTQYYYP